MTRERKPSRFPDETVPFFAGRSKLSGSFAAPVRNPRSSSLTGTRGRIGVNVGKRVDDREGTTLGVTAESGRDEDSLGQVEGRQGFGGADWVIGILRLGKS